MRFWSLMPSTGMSVCASTPNFSPAVFTPAAAMVQKDATPLDTKAILGFLPELGAALPVGGGSADLLQAVRAMPSNARRLVRKILRRELLRYRIASKIQGAPFGERLGIGCLMLNVERSLGSVPGNVEDRAGRIFMAG